LLIYNNSTHSQQKLHYDKNELMFVFHW